MFDGLSLQVELVYAIGWLHADDDDAWTIPVGGVNEYHVFRLVFTAYVLQLLLTMDYENQQGTPEKMENIDENGDATTEDENAVIGLLENVYKAAFGDDPVPATISARYSYVWPGLVSRVKSGLVRGFLRPAALFFHALTHVPPPEALKDPSINEFGPLCRFLGVPVVLSDVLTKFVDMESIMR